MLANSLSDQLAPSDRASAKSDFTEEAITQCFHCGESLPPASNITLELNGVDRPMCCMGCKAVAQIIQQQGLDEFYCGRDTRHRNSVETKQGSESGYSSTINFDDWNVSSSLTKQSAIIRVPGIYCSSCTWLLQRKLKELDLNIDARIKLDSKTIHLEWSGEAQRIIDIISGIQELGYRVHPLSSSSSELQALVEQEKNDLLKRIVVAGLGTMQVMSFALADYLGAMQSPPLAHFLELVSMIVASFVVLYSGRQFFVNAIIDLQNKRIGMDVPVALAIGSAFFLSAWQTLMQLENRTVYYDSAVMFVFFLLIGRFVEARARAHFVDTGDAIERTLPKQVDVYRQQGKVMQRLSLAPTQIKIDDELRLSQGEVAPCDSIIIGGVVEVNESLITGEATPKSYSPGHKLLAGMSIVSGDVVVRCEYDWPDSSLAKIESILQNSSHSQHLESGWQAAFNRYFLAGVLLATMLIGAFWFVYQPENAFKVVLAMLIATCPCAFALAAPVATTVASNKLRALGVLVATPAKLATLARAACWCFDKTGTLTRGAPSIASVELLSDVDEQRCVDLISAIERHSKHPIASAFASRVAPFDASNVVESPGCGIAGEIQGQRYYVGKRDWVCGLLNLESAAVKETSASVYSGYLTLYLSDASKVLAVVRLVDAPRVGLNQLFDELRRHAVKRVLLSGDAQTSVTNFSTSYDFDATYSQMSPQDKVNELIRLSDQCSPIVMVGDGINDALVLSHADVSIAQASGSELSHSQADIILLNSDLTALAQLRNIAMKTKQVMTQNLFWAIAYNLSILPLAALGVLTPWMAAIGMSLSSLAVVINAARINNEPRN